MLKEAFQRLGSVIKAFSDAARAAALEARRAKGKGKEDKKPASATGATESTAGGKAAEGDEPPGSPQDPSGWAEGGKHNLLDEATGRYPKRSDKFKQEAAKEIGALLDKPGEDWKGSIDAKTFSKVKDASDFGGKFPVGSLVSRPAHSSREVGTIASFAELNSEINRYATQYRTPAGMASRRSYA